VFRIAHSQLAELSSGGFQILREAPNEFFRDPLEELSSYARMAGDPLREEPGDERRLPAAGPSAPATEMVTAAMIFSRFKKLIAPRFPLLGLDRRRAEVLPRTTNHLF
jgi:hypothetical protein